MKFARQCFKTAGMFVAGIVFWLASAAFSVAIAVPSAGTTYSDLWWNPAEPGWGVTVDHQDKYTFLTFFIYKADGTPYWVIAGLDQVGTPNFYTSPVTFTGGVYEATGPYYGGAFDPSKVKSRQVGTATFTANTIYSANLTYTINGTTVTKALQRETLKNLNYSGSYTGALSLSLAACGVPETIYQYGDIIINQSQNTIAVVATISDTKCTFTGNYFQNGSVGAAAGKFDCGGGFAGTFELNALQWTIMGFTGSVSGIAQGCSFYGLIGGIVVNRD